MDRIVIEEMTWPEVRAALDARWDRVLLPIGSTEQHGPHLPTASDSLHTWEVARRVARTLGRTLVAPMLPVGCSEHHMAFPGTITLTKETLEAYVHDCCRSLARHGFKTVLIFSGHGGNHGPIADIVPKLRGEFPELRLVAYADVRRFFDGLMESAKRHGIPEEVAGGHSGELETSMLLALRPELVHLDRLEPGYLGPLAPVQERTLREGLAAITANGVMGDPRPADRARGEAYLSDYADQIAAHFRAELGESTTDAARAGA
jgi:creatinine amidohydrolase